MTLSLETATADIEEALRRTVSRQLRRRLPAVADIAALRAFATRGASGTASLVPGELIPATSTGYDYEWWEASTVADDGATGVRPSDVGASDPGRWIRAVKSRSGVARAVIVHNGDFSDDAIERLYSQVPSYVIHYAGGSYRPLSQLPGAVYDYRPRFVVWAMSRCLRPEAEGSLGSGISSEYADDPGAMALIGKLRGALAGAVPLDGVKYVEILEEGVEEVDLAERQVTLYLSVEVRATFVHPNEAGADPPRFRGLQETPPIGAKWNFPILDRG